MKKILSIVISLTLALTLIACSDQNDTKQQTVVSMEAFDTTPTIQKTTIYDKNNIKITADSLHYSDSEVKLSVTLENNTDKNLSFICGSANYHVNSINGYMIDDGYVNSDIPASQSSTETVSFNIDEINAFGITKISDMQIGFQINDENYSFVEYTGALPIKTSIYDSYDYKTNSYQQIINNGAFENKFNSKLAYFSDKNIFKNYGISIDSVTVMSDSSSKPLLMLELKNNSDKLQYIKIKKVLINDVSVYDSLWTSTSINADKKHILDIDLSHLASKYSGDASKVNEISKITFEISVGETFSEAKNTDTVNITLPQIKVSAE